MNTTKGLKPKDRKLVIATQKNKLTANQWQNTPQQNLFMEYWLEPSSETFGNSFASAMKAKYSRSYAVQLSSPAINNKWIQEYTKGTVMDAEHTKKALQDVYLNPKTYNNSRSPADTRLKALELLAKVNGMVDTGKGNTTVNIVQPILGGESVNRPPKQASEVIDITEDNDSEADRTVD